MTRMINKAAGFQVQPFSNVLIFSEFPAIEEAGTMQPVFVLM